ncbi:MAG: beta-1,3-glucanase family protein [Gemmataceae bacterium]
MPSGVTINFINQTTPPNPTSFFVAITDNNHTQYFDASANSWKPFSQAPGGNVPSFPLFSSITIPDGYSGIIVIFAGAQNSLPGSGAPGPTDPNVQSVPYELVEYTTNGANSSIDTSQVDQFGFPLTLTDNSNDGHNHAMVGVMTNLTREDEFTRYQAFMTNQGTNGTPYLDLVVPLGSISTGSNTVVRVMNPGKYLAVNPFNNSSLHTVFDGAIQSLFQRTDLQIQVIGAGGGLDGTYTGTPTTASALDRDNNMATYNVLQFTGPGGTFNIFEPFFSNSGGPGNGYAGKPLSPHWIQTIGPDNKVASPGSMVFQGNGVFADYAGGANSQGNNLAAAAIELQLNAALNRGISNLATSEWNNSGNYYPANNQPRNLYAQFLHQKTGPTAVFIDGLAYGFAYDEGTGGPSKIDFDDSTTPTISITLGAWSPTRFYAAGADAGGGPRVKVYNTDGSTRFDFFAYNPFFMGGVRVALGDVNGDGIPDIITAAGPGGGPHVKVFDGETGAVIRSFFAYDPSFTGGVFVDAADVNGDGFADIITGAGAGGGPHVKVFDGQTGAVRHSFFAYNPAFPGGVNVSSGDVNGDGVPDIITGAGPGGGPHVRAFNGVNLAQLANFFAYDAAFSGGVWVAAGDVADDFRAEIITGAGAGGGPHVKVFTMTGQVVGSFMAYDSSFRGGVRVGVIHLDSDGHAEILAGVGPTGGTAVRIFDGLSLNLVDTFFAFDPLFRGGVFVGE